MFRVSLRVAITGPVIRHSRYKIAIGYRYSPIVITEILSDVVPGDVVLDVKGVRGKTPRSTTYCGHTNSQSPGKNTRHGMLPFSESQFHEQHLFPEYSPN